MEFSSPNYASLKEILPVFHAWRATRTTHGIDLTLPLEGWPPAMWQNLARRVEIEGTALFGAGRPALLRLTTPPPRPGQAAEFTEAAAGSPSLTYSLKLSQDSLNDSPELLLARSDGWRLIVFWDYRTGQGEAATRALHALTSELCASARQMFTEGFLYDCPATKRECLLKLVKHPTHRWVWHVSWGLAEGRHREFLLSPAGIVFLANGEADPSAPLPAALGRHPTPMTTALSDEHASASYANAVAV